MQRRTELNETPRLPDGVAALLFPSEQVLHTIQSDMTLTGRYGDSAWLVVTDSRLVAVDPVHPDGRLVVSYADLTRARVRRLYGSLVLEVELSSADGSAIVLDAFRCSYKHSDALFECEEAVNRSAEERTGSEPEGRLESRGGSGKGKCRGCGRPLPPGHEICLECIDKRKILKRSFGYLAKYRGLFTASLSVTVAVTAMRLLPPYLTVILVDDVLAVKNTGAMVWMIAAILGVYVLQAILGVAHIYLTHWLGNRVVVDLRTDVYRHVQRLALKFYDKRQTGWIMSRVTNDTSFLQNFMVNQVQEIVVHVLTLVGIAIVLFMLDPFLALLALVPTPLVLLGTTAFAKRMHRVYHRIWRRVSNMHAVLGDTIPGIRVVKAFTREDEEVAKFAHSNEQVFEENMKAIRMASLFYPAMGLTTAIGLVIVWGYGGLQVIADAITLGTLVGFISYMGQFYAPIQALSRSTEQLQGAITAAERLFEILDTQPEPDENEGTRMQELKGEIVFDDVSFYYEKGDPVLQGINFTIRPGEMIGLVGSSGSGKTTLVNLIARFYEVSEGRILLDGVDLKDVDLQFLRENVGMVLQEPFLFHGSIAENIAYGRPGASMSDIVRAAMMANAHGFIMEMADRYDTRIGERGVGLSGGQKQRISIARAILKDPRILILDEATSAVDTETERLIQEAIDRLVQGRTTIAIAHRLSTLQAADRLFVMQDGRIAETGTHAELLAKEDGVFAKMVQMQAEIAKARAV